MCEVELKTYSWEEWAAEPQGQPPVSYLYEGFDKLLGPGGVFGPEYFTIGCVGHFKEFITPEMVTVYLRGDNTVDWRKRNVCGVVSPGGQVIEISVIPE